MCKCVLYYCHRLSTQLQLTNLVRDQVLHPYKVCCVCSLFHLFTVPKTVAVLLVCVPFQYLISVTVRLVAYTIITCFKSCVESGSPAISAARGTMSVPTYKVISLQHFLSVAVESLVLCLEFGSDICAPFGGHLPLRESFVVFSAPTESTGILSYRGAEKSLARPARKQANVSVRMA